MPGSPAFTARSLAILGGGCLLIALILSFLLLPQSFRPLPREDFQSHILESASRRDAVELTRSTSPFAHGDAIVLEWKAAQP